MTTPTLPARRKPTAPPLGPAPVWERDKLFQEPALPVPVEDDFDDEDQER